MLWRREWQPTPVFLPGEFHRQRGLAGPSPQGQKESDTTERLTLSLHTPFSLTFGRVVHPPSHFLLPPFHGAPPLALGWAWRHLHHPLHPAVPGQPLGVLQSSAWKGSRGLGRGADLAVGSRRRGVSSSGLNGSEAEITAPPQEDSRQPWLQGGLPCSS